MSASIFDSDERGYICDGRLRDRALDIRATLIQSGAILPLSSRPTLRLRPEDERHVMRHVHEGAWTIGLHEEDLPGFVAEEVHP